MTAKAGRGVQYRLNGVEYSGACKKATTLDVEYMALSYTRAGARRRSQPRNRDLVKTEAPGS